MSARHTDTIYKISHLDGSIVWRLGGTKSDFQLPDGWKFSRQHDAQVLEQNDTHTIITLFDNGMGAGPFEHATTKISRGLVLLLNTAKMRADIIAEYKKPSRPLVNSRGTQ
jgi:hypothetical protein